MAGTALRSAIGGNPECRHIVEQLTWVEVWSPRVILWVCLFIGCFAFLSGLHRGEVSIWVLLLGLFLGAAVGLVINSLVSRFMIGPMRSVCYSAVAHRLRSRTITHSVKDWRGWAHDTPGIAALVQSDQLFLCDHSTGYDELLLSHWQIGSAKVERVVVAAGLPQGGWRLTKVGRRTFWKEVFGGKPRLDSRIEENAFLEILYFVRHDKPVRSTRIPFGSAYREAEGWMAALTLSKRQAGGVQ